MYQVKKTFIKPDMKMSNLIFENPSLLLLMENFEIDFIVHDKTVKQLCLENNLRENLFVAFANLYNGFYNIDINDFSKEEVYTIIKYLKNSHKYYKNEILKEIKNYIVELYSANSATEIKLIDKFFNEYYREVIEHLNYEEQIAFPYFTGLIKGTPDTDTNFSVEEYRNHHSDIESKLEDLQNLLLKHITVKKDKLVRRKLLFKLFELNKDLAIHSSIEEIILTPLVHKIEQEIFD